MVIDTRSPAALAVITSFLDPAINVWHQLEPFTLTDETGREREILIAEDEFAGAVGTGQCPNGGVHVYEVSGGLGRSPQKVGYFNIAEAGPTDQLPPDGRCTAHVFQVHEDEQIMTMAWLQRRRPGDRPLRPHRDLDRQSAAHGRRHEGARLLPDPGHGLLGSRGPARRRPPRARG